MMLLLIILLFDFLLGTKKFYYHIHIHHTIRRDLALGNLSSYLKLLLKGQTGLNNFFTYLRERDLPVPC